MKLAIFDNTSSSATKIANNNLFYQLAHAIFDVMKPMYNKNGMYGRTIRGVFVELVIHYYAYNFGIKTSNCRETEIGSFTYDYNAYWWESIAFNYKAYSIILGNSKNKIKKLINENKQHL